MSHNDVTQSRPIPMPRHSGLMCRNGRFYLNVRVPTDLRPLYGKKDIVRKSLGTSDRREALSRLHYEAFKLDSEFTAKRKALEASETEVPPSQKLREIADREAHELVFRWFIGLEKMSDEWWAREGVRLPDEELKESLDTLRVDERALTGGNDHYAWDNGSHDLNAFLKAEGLDCPKDSPAYRKLCELFRKARLESTQRTLDRMTQQPVMVREPLFSGVFAHHEKGARAAGDDH